MSRAENSFYREQVDFIRYSPHQLLESEQIFISSGQLCSFYNEVHVR